MLTKRIIPCLDVANGRVVKGTHFTLLRDVGDAVDLAQLYAEQGADELCFLDITATVEKRKTLVDLVSRVGKVISIPFTVGGGISSVEDIRAVLLAGADKVSIGTAAVANPSLISEAAAEFGSQAIVISVDAKRTGPEAWTVYTNGGREDTGMDALRFCFHMEELGAGELLINSIDRDGTRTGYDLELLRAINDLVDIPVIASSGAGSKEHFLEALREGQADAVLAASLFHSRELSILELKQYLSSQNILIRL
ncbi:MAG: imidazole glycerol phosphate synthase subunit HisF [bacterium]|nr:imidazole glycerol phosphate synthase subunit HisF [bacterium]